MSQPYRISYVRMQQTRRQNIHEQLLRDDITSDRYTDLSVLAVTAFTEALDQADLPNAQAFLELNRRTVERQAELPAYQSAAYFLTAIEAEIVA